MALSLDHTEKLVARATAAIAMRIDRRSQEIYAKQIKHIKLTLEIIAGNRELLKSLAADTFAGRKTHEPFPQGGDKISASDPPST